MPTEIYCDGSSRGQGSVPGVNGIGAVGVVIYKNSKFVAQYARGLGRVTNNEAEFEAVLTALMLAWGNPNFDDVIIYTDSQLVEKTVNGNWHCWNENLRPLLMSIQEIQSVFRCRVIWTPRAGVVEADKLANQFLDNLQIRLDKDELEHREYLRLKKKNSHK